MKMSILFVFHNCYMRKAWVSDVALGHDIHWVNYRDSRGRICGRNTLFPKRGRRRR